MRQLRALDLFCGAGGATKGLQQAGYHVTGVDINHQPNYCGDRFIQGDALTTPLSGYDLIWASPPCQRFTWAQPLHKIEHADLVTPIRNRLNCLIGVSYVIENVPGCPLIDPITLCGLYLGLNVKRHRIFESNAAIVGTPCPKGHPGDWLIIFGWTPLRRSNGQGTGPRKDRGKSKGKSATHAEACAAMGIDWMNRKELAQSIPPAYAKWIGDQFTATARTSSTPAESPE